MRRIYKPPQIKICKAGFTYEVQHRARNGKLKSVEIVHNIMPAVALNYLLNAALLGATQYTSWYVGLYSNSYTPTSSDTMTTFMASCGENSSYSGTTRQSVSLPTAVAGATSLSSSDSDVNVFTFSADATITGGFITTGSAWDGTTGLLLSAAQFSTAKEIESGETLTIPLGFALVSA